MIKIIILLFFFLFSYKSISQGIDNTFDKIIVYYYDDPKNAFDRIDLLIPKADSLVEAFKDYQKLVSGPRIITTLDYNDAKNHTLKNNDTIDTIYTYLVIILLDKHYYHNTV